MQPKDLPRDEKKAMARSMAAKTDMPAAQIARSLGVQRQTVQKWIKGLRPRIRRTLAQTWALKEQAWTLCETTTQPLREIAKQIGVPFGTVQRWCQDVERPERVKLTAPAFKHLNQKLWLCGMPIEERRNFIAKEARRAA